MPSVMFTVMPGLRLAAVAPCPFTLISVNWVIQVGDVLPSSDGME